MKHREWCEAANYPGRNCNCGADPVSSDLTEKIGEVLNNITSSSESKLGAMSAEAIIAEWLWQWDEKKNAEWNTYEFNKALELHRWRWRRWEEMHNGSCCVVERVRDKYVMPRVREFLAALDAHRGGHG